MLPCRLRSYFPCAAKARRQNRRFLTTLKNAPPHGKNRREERFCWIKHLNMSPVPIAFEQITNGANGYFSLTDKRIAIKEGVSELQAVKTAIHEIAHAKLHDVDLNAPPEQQNRVDRHTCEVEAESVAYSSYVVVDPKGGTLDQCGRFLQREKYRVRVFNSIDFSKSMHYNPLAYIKTKCWVLLS